MNKNKHTNYQSCQKTLQLVKLETLWNKLLHLGKRPKKKNSKCKLFPKGGGGNPKVYIFSN